MAALDKLYTVSKIDIQDFLSERGLPLQELREYYSEIAFIVNPDSEPVSVDDVCAGAAIFSALLMTRPGNPNMPGNLRMYDAMLLGSQEWEDYSPHDFKVYFQNHFSDGFLEEPCFQGGLYPFLLAELLLVNGKVHSFNVEQEPRSNLQFDVDWEDHYPRSTHVTLFPQYIGPGTRLSGEPCDIFFDKASLCIGAKVLKARPSILRKGGLVMTDTPQLYWGVNWLEPVPLPEELTIQGHRLAEAGFNTFGYEPHPFLFRRVS